MALMRVTAGTLLVLAALAAGCGDALSSLQLVQQGDGSRYQMLLDPDFGRQGERLLVAVDFEPELVSRLDGQAGYPTELAFGAGIQIEYFGPGSGSPLELAVRIESAAATGERRPTMTFSTREGPVTAQGSFWILPPQAE